MLAKLQLWPVRLLWLLLPVVAGPGILDAVADRSAPVRAVVEIGMWAAWFMGLIATLAPSTVTLTIIRILAPAVPATAIVAAVGGGNWASLTVLAVGYGIVVTFVTNLPTTGDPMINGSAYGSERRMALRPPAMVLLGPIQLAWLVVFTGAITGPLLLAGKQWLVGIPVTLVGIGAVAIGTRSLHQLSRRWIVFVPAGFVIHDYLSLAESILIQRRQKPTLGPAPADIGDALDVSGNALGLALSVAVDEAVPVAIRDKGQINSSSADTFVFTPSLPGQLLQEARLRAITIG
jgi:hypothetical protein